MSTFPALIIILSFEKWLYFSYKNTVGRLEVLDKQKKLTKLSQRALKLRTWTFLQKSAEMRPF